MQSSSVVRPGANVPGHQARHGLRKPPSQLSAFPPRNGHALPPAPPLSSQGPLSDAKITSVCSAIPWCRSAASKAPTWWSTSVIASPYRPRAERPANDDPTAHGSWGAE